CMAPPISDAVIVDVFRRVDVLTAPVLRRAGRPPAVPQAERDQWWAHRVARVVAVLSAAPRFAAQLAGLFLLRDTVGPTFQAAARARSGGWPGCWAGSTMRSTPARRASGGTACSPTCPSSGSPAAISPSARACAAPPPRRRPPWRIGSADSGAVRREVRVHLT